MKGLAGKNILVSGASRGLGLEISKALLESGAKVIGLARKSNAAVEELTSLYPEQWHFFEIDLGETDLLEEKVKQYLKDNKLAINGLVNNAALGSDALITDLTEEYLIGLIKVNQIAPILMSKQVIRNMLLHENTGSIVHISSVSAWLGYTALSAYASTKGAIEAFSRSCAREWGKKGIRSNTIAAGFMETDMTSEMKDETKLKIYARNALKKATEISSVVSTVLFLLSDESSSITGKSLGVDAGAF